MSVHYDGLVGSVYPTKEEEVYLVEPDQPVLFLVFAVGRAASGSSGQWCLG